ncbi:VanZ family protein [Vibrio sp. RE86]|uniref:VanZ family protein n=1 Tax=Vibrio sp. RE86 TaxID=2607605 RepID=UPI00149350C2|nr:VanZ family protein [Vibrio sp. RE86]NOH79913.1 VanZ family protein [Vibrio sp. RE86]
MQSLILKNLINRRAGLLLVLVIVGGLASMAKTFGVLGDVVRDIELLLGGDWALHALLASFLGLTASWATPKQWLHRSFFLMSPVTFVVLLLVVIDESLQAFNPQREFSALDMLINITGVTTGALIYVSAKRFLGANQVAKD